jgi:hypothetical protein
MDTDTGIIGLLVSFLLLAVMATIKAKISKKPLDE